MFNNLEYSCSKLSQSLTMSRINFLLSDSITLHLKEIFQIKTLSFVKTKLNCMLYV